MQIQTSPGGSLFPYCYKNGELFRLHFGSYFSDEDGVIAMMKAEETFISRQHRPMGIWIDLYETKLTDKRFDYLFQASMKEDVDQLLVQFTARR